MRTVIITGASRGIGKAIAKRFAAEGDSVIMNCSSRFSDLDAVAEEIQEQFGTACCCVHGMICEDSLRTAMEAVEAEHAEELILINNAGISRVGLLQDVSDEEWQEMIDSNLGTMFRASRAVLPYMLHRQSGRIINISSVWGEAGASCEAIYSMTKGGMNAFTRALAKELAPSGIAVNALACGAIDTEMNVWMNQEEREELENEIPAGRMASPEEVADMVVQLAGSPHYLNGQIIRFDGAWI